MGFWPYFLHAHESDGGYASPLLLDPSASGIGIDTTLFCIPLLLFSPHNHHNLSLIFKINLQNKIFKEKN